MEKLISTQIKPKTRHNYVAFFLTLACNLRCSYCINQHNKALSRRQAKIRHLTGLEWIRAANRLILRPDLPLTFQGGEPTLRKDFYLIVNEVKEEVKMDLLTNMAFDVDEFIKRVPVKRFTREAPYAPIRVSFHPGENDLDEIISKTFKLQDAGFRVGIYGIIHPEDKIQSNILSAQEKCLKIGIDFRLKEFLGVYNGKMYGTFKYEGCVGGDRRNCECRTTELIVDPEGFVYKCHSDLYAGRGHIAHILDGGFNVEEMEKFRECKYFGQCNPCDVKVKTNRHQIFGHTSVEIRNIR